jgi:uncharacterized protein with ATP-grasp and redox domains
MKIGPDCIPCILKMCLGFIRKTGLSEPEVFRVFGEVLKIPALKGEGWHVTSPDVIEEVMHITYSLLGDADPLRKEKAALNRLLLDQYDVFEKMAKDAQDPLKMAVKMAALGNAVDIMVSEDLSGLQAAIREKTERPLSEKNFRQLKEQLSETRRLLYFGDNAGEIVLDKLLISVLKKRFDLETTFVVRSNPTLNDVTLREARSVKMDEVARVLENGIEGPFPGTRVGRCSLEIQELYREADLVISKGGGNFDSLDEDKTLHKQNISFLLLSKCHLYERLFQTPLELPILSNFYHCCG